MGKILFYIARFKITGVFVGIALMYFPFLIPIKKIIQSKKAISFIHPLPIYQNHILIIPRKVAKNVFCLSAENFLGVIEMAVKIRNGDDRDFVLLINGGKRQDVMQAHFHLFTGNMVVQKGLCEEDGIQFRMVDKVFWEQFVCNIHDLIRKYGIFEESFSVFIQFKKNTQPSIYII